MGQRLAVDGAPAAFVAERRGGGGQGGQRARQGSPLSHTVNCSLDTREEVNEALDGGVTRQRATLRTGRKGRGAPR